MFYALRSRAFIGLLCIFFFTLTGCAQKATATPTPTLSYASATSSDTPVPISAQKDVMILSVEENGYAHLFGYAPGTLTLTRITSGPWNDIDPPPSPDPHRTPFPSDRPAHSA